MARTDDHITTTVRIPRDVDDMIKHECEARAIGRARMFEILLRLGLQHLPEVPDALA